MGGTWTTTDGRRLVSSQHHALEVSACCCLAVRSPTSCTMLLCLQAVYPLSPHTLSSENTSSQSLWRAGCVFLGWDRC